MSESVKVQFALVSHTNNGKTTLARTLVGMDVGEVRDAAHVTTFSESTSCIAQPNLCVITIDGPSDRAGSGRERPVRPEPEASA